MWSDASSEYRHVPFPSLHEMGDDEGTRHDISAAKLLKEHSRPVLQTTSSLASAPAFAPSPETQADATVTAIARKFVAHVRFPAPIERVIALQKWEGHVTAIGLETFSARLVDARSEEPDYEAEFSIDEVSPSDRELVAEGAVFYWTVGYRVTPAGNRSMASFLRFRRLPPAGPEELEAARLRANAIAKRLAWGHSNGEPSAGGE